MVRVFDLVLKFVLALVAVAVFVVIYLEGAVQELLEEDLATLQHYRREGSYKLHGYVLMPDHVHLLLTPTGVPLERCMMLIKGGYSHRLQAKFPFWQRGFVDHRIRDRQDFVRHREYLHHNPVRARLCQLPEDWPWSSAYRGQTHLSG